MTTFGDNWAEHALSVSLTPREDDSLLAQLFGFSRETEQLRSYAPSVHIISMLWSLPGSVREENKKRKR
jgi:hypothetical protein